MPQRDPTRNPTIIAGSPIESGTPNTGQVSYTWGGQHGASGTFSGNGSILLQLGAGRLDTIQAIVSPSVVGANSAASGRPVVWYDTNVAGAIGFAAESGHRLLAAIDPRVLQSPNNVSFNSGLLMYGSPPYQVGVPFTSGLCVMALSGAPGYACSWTTAVSG